MSKKLLVGEQMSAVAEAQGWAKNLVAQESRGPGDTEQAMHRLERRYGISFWVLWSLRYKPPKSIAADIWKRIQHAYVYECDRQARRLAHEARITQLAAARTRHDDLIDESAALLAASKNLVSGLDPDVAITEAIMKNRVDVE